MTRDTAPHPASPAPIPKEDISVDATKVVRRLARNGFDTYLVGGCVRDLLLGLHPKDFDIATSARPRQVKRLFRNSRIIGRRFRLVHVRFGDHIVEVATFRAPPEQEGDDLYIQRDNIFGTEESDAKRRDFTINALFYDVRKERVIDHVGGLDDLEARLMRTIGDPEVRLQEDPVRILRAARFAGRLGFDLADDLKAAIRTHAVDVEKAAPARVLEEIFRLAAGRGAAAAFRVLDGLGVTPHLLPELSPLPDEFFASLEALEAQTGGDRDQVPQSLLVALLLAPLVLPGFRDHQPREPDSFAADRMRPFCERLTVPRRDQARARHALAAQTRFMHPPSSRGARRYCTRDFFDEAMRLRRIVGPLEPLEDGAEDPADAWAALKKELDTGRVQVPKRRRKRRRRRRGRGRGPKSGEGGAGA